MESRGDGNGRMEVKQRKERKGWMDGWKPEFAPAGANHKEHRASSGGFWRGAARMATRGGPAMVTACTPSHSHLSPSPLVEIWVTTCTTRLSSQSPLWRLPSSLSPLCGPHNPTQAQRACTLTGYQSMNTNRIFEPYTKDLAKVQASYGKAI